MVAGSGAVPPTPTVVKNKAICADDSATLPEFTNEERLTVKAASVCVPGFRVEPNWNGTGMLVAFEEFPPVIVSVVEAKANGPDETPKSSVTEVPVIVPNGPPS
jgi:hypothetical protein